MTLVDDLKAARALIADEAKWFQGDYQSDDCTQMCASHAVRTVTGRPEGYTDTPSYRLLERLCGTTVCQFNDSHPHADVMALFDRAIDAALQSIQPVPALTEGE